MGRKRSLLGIGSVFSMSLVVMFLVAIVNPGFASDKPIELSITHLFPEGSWFNQEAVVPWKKLVEEKSKGRLIINIYPSGALAKPGTMYDAVKAGTVDIAWDPGPYYIGRFPLSEATQLPFLGAESSWAASRAWMDLYAQFPELRKEYDDVHFLFMFSQGPGQIYARKPVRNLDDLKGLIVRAPGGIGDIVKALGGSPVTLTAPETYLALSKGTIDATVFDLEAAKLFKLYEVTKYITVANMYVQWFWAAMNKAKYDSLPKDLQKVIDECSGTVGTDIVGKAWNEADKVGAELAKQKGMELISLSPGERKLWADQSASVTNEWLKTMEGKGYPAKQFLEAAKKAIEKYNQKFSGDAK